MFYLGRRVSTTSFHEPLKRIHSRGRNLEKLDKTDGKAKEHKRRSREGIRVLPKIKEDQESHDHFEDRKENQEVLKYVDEGKHRHRHHSRHHREHKVDQKDHKLHKDKKDGGEKKPHHHHHHHHRHHHRHPPPALHHHRTISEREQLESRLRSGALTLKEIEPIQERLATEKDEASVLAKRDLEEMACKLLLRSDVTIYWIKSHIFLITTFVSLFIIQGGVGRIISFASCQQDSHF